MTDEPQSPTPQAPGEEFDESLKDTPYGKLKPIRITKEMQRSYLNYAMSVIVSRALPDVRDGLKPVHRRILYAMKDMGITYNTSYKKCARIVGEVLGKYHPHGDSAVYDALVRLAQDFSMRYPLIQGQGNFGSIDGDSPAAMRYTEARLAKITEELLIDIKKDTVPFEDTFDGSQQEPTVLPAKLPNLLLMGGDGIAVGMATKIPPHNLNEVINAVIHLINEGKADKEPLSEQDQQKNVAVIEPEKLTGDFQSQSSIEELLEHINGPDFPTGGTIYDWEEIKKVYTTGKGRVVTRAKTEIVEQKGGKFQIIVNEIPYQVNKAKLITKIADLVKQKKLDGISDLRDESDREGLRIAIDLKRNARPKSLLNNLFKHTDLQSNYPANMVALNSDGTPQLMNLKTILTEYVRHRQLVIVRRAQYDLLSAQERAHILEGLLIALDHLDEVIEIIRNSEDADKAKERLMGNFDLSERQAVAILDMQLRRLAALERKKIEDEYKELKQQIDQLTKLLSEPKEMLKLIIDELKEVKDEYGDERQTILVKPPIGKFSEQDLIPEEEVVVTLTKTGYIKRLPPNTYRSQRRGGKGVTGMKTKEDDVITHILMANTHDNLLVFTNRGKVFKLPVYELPATSRQAKGQAIINLINIEQGEEVQSLIAVSDKLDKIKDKYIALATKNGIVKKTAVKEFQNIRSTGIIAIVLNDGDEVVWSDLTHGKHDILMVSHQGKSIRFHESDVRSTARDTKGVKGINLKKGDYVDAVETIDTTIEPPDDKRRKFFHDLMVITENGMGKRTPIKEYPVQKRGGQGVKVANLTKKTGDVGAALSVTQDIEQILITTKKGQVIKLPLRNIPQLKRPTQGVILMRLKKGDKIVSATAVEAEDEE